MIEAWTADAGGVRRVELGEAVRVAHGRTGAAWVDLDGEDEAMVREALGPCGVHPLVIDDMVMENNRPKVDDYGEYLYLVVHSARWSPGEARPALREIDIVLGRHLLVTYHDGETRSAKAAAALLPKRPELLATGPAPLLHHLLDVMVDHYLPIMDRISDDVDTLEEVVFTADDPTVHSRIVRLKRGIAALRRIVGPQRDTILALTRDEFRPIPAEIRPYLRDVYDRLARVSDLLDSYRDEVASLLELHAAMASNRLNLVIKRLTVIATVGLPLTVITSYYGMNLRLPEYGWAHGQGFVLGLLATAGLVTWGYLRWRGWD
jgi:magnesium transporter